MVWFKVDDRFHGSEPVKKIDREHRAAAVGLWTLAGTWSAQFLKNGNVPGHMLDEFCGTPQLAQCLVDVGLWKKTKHGYVFVDWSKWQPTREKIEQKHADDARRAAEYRARIAANKGDNHEGVTRDDSVSHASVHASRPDPTRPDPTTSPDGEVAAPRKRATRIPDGFTVTAEMAKWARERCPLVDGRASTERFVNYWKAKSGKDATKLDWTATWRNWLLKDQQDAENVPNRNLSPEQRMRATLALAGDDTKEIAS